MTQTFTTAHAKKPPSYATTSIAAQLEKYARALFSSGGEGWSQNDANLLNHSIAMANPTDLLHVAWASFRLTANFAKSHFLESGQFKPIEISKEKP